LWEYEKVLKAHDVPLGQPALSAKTKNWWPLVHQNKTYVLRWTSFVENVSEDVVHRSQLSCPHLFKRLASEAAMLPPYPHLTHVNDVTPRATLAVIPLQGPLFSLRVAQDTFRHVWDMVSPNAVTGYGVDMAWCHYLHERKGYRPERTCAVVDAHPIDHIDSRTGTVSSGQVTSSLLALDLTQVPERSLARAHHTRGAPTGSGGKTRSRCIGRHCSCKTSVI
jgi:hypothetical protein